MRPLHCLYILCFTHCSFVSHAGHSTFNHIKDPIEDIIEYLDLSYQQIARLINREWNHMITKSHSTAIKAAQALRAYIWSKMKFNGTVGNDRIESKRTWLNLYNEVQYNELYLRLWPRVLEQPNLFNLSSPSVLNLHHTIEKMYNRSNHGLQPVIRILIQSSQILFQSGFMSAIPGISEYKSF